jgi:two-component system, LuxR family, response regulator FixJ
MVFTVIPGSDILIVDDDAAARNALSFVVNSAGYSVTTFVDGDEFLIAARAKVPSCIIIDLHMPGRSGIALLKELNAQYYPTPIFIVSGDDNTDFVVEAIKNGAFDYILKPFDGRSVVYRIGAAISAFAKRIPNGEFFDSSPCQQLTARESEVLAQISSGASNKEAGRRLSISPRTIEVHRSHIMGKLGARNTADLMRIVFNPSARLADRSVTPSPKLGRILINTRGG